MSNALKLDLYQLTMAQGYWKAGRAERESVFNLYFRKCPFKGNYAIVGGISSVVEFLKDFKYTLDDILYLGQQKGNDGEPLFDSEFLKYLHNLKFSCDIHAMEEGSVAFSNQPILRVEGPIVQCQLLETALLQIVNFQTLIATKASRIVKAADGDPVIEFGYRRSQDPMGASKASYIGGCVATSNVCAGKQYGIPIKGTHAHSWVMSFPDELTAFRKYAESMPNNCVFLVDTYDTIQGVKNAITVAKEMRKDGHEMLGIRLDSGDMVKLSIEARKLLDEAGFVNANIVASNDLDEYAIEEMKVLGSKINIWGIGTKLVTAYDQPALGGVYKLAAIQADDGNWDYKMKLGSATKESYPGFVQVKRIFKNGNHLCDYLYDLSTKRENLVFKDPLSEDCIDMFDIDNGKYEAEDLLSEIYQNGHFTGKINAIEDARQRSLSEVETVVANTSNVNGLTLMEESYSKLREEVKKRQSK
jgi:nicotinate phosphoribosyltransferase